MHTAQYRGFFANGARPTARSTGANGPWNGEAQIAHRGGLGRREKAQRSARVTRRVPIRMVRQSASFPRSISSGIRDQRMVARCRLVRASFVHVERVSGDLELGDDSDWCCSRGRPGERAPFTKSIVRTCLHSAPLTALAELHAIAIRALFNCDDYARALLREQLKDEEFSERSDLAHDHRRLEAWNGCDAHRAL